jgi:hypothetical protein
MGGIVGEARLWDVSSRKPLGPALEFRGEAHAAAFSPDGKTFATGAFKLITWDAATSQQISTAGAESVVFSLAFSPDGRHVLARLWEEEAARFFDAHTGTPVGPHMRHASSLKQVSLSPDGRFVLTCSEDRQAQLWDAATGLPLGPPWSQLSLVPRGAFTADSRGVLLQGIGFLSRWGIPEPLEGTPEQIRLTVEAAVRFSLDTYGSVRFLFPTLEPDPTLKQRFKLGADPYEAIRKRLDELGGPLGYFRR